MKQYYLLKAGQALTPKNNYQLAIQDYIRSIDRMVISDINSFDENLNISLSAIHARHERCKEETSNWYPTHIAHKDRNNNHDYAKTIGGITIHLIYFEF